MRKREDCGGVVYNQVICGDATKVMEKKLEPNSIDFVLTSPPYDNLRTYSGHKFHADWIIFALYRVLKPGGVVVWVVGDSTHKGSESGTSFSHVKHFRETGFLLHDTMIFEKNTCSFPARRGGNRYSQIFEYMFVFSKDAPPKTANLICDKRNKWAGWTNWGKQTKRKKDKLVVVKDINPVPEFSPRNNIWKYNVGGGFGHKDASAHEHPATFPERLAVDHITTWTNPGDLVLDPMCGSGTACVAAKKLGRGYIGIDVSAEYCELTKKRLARVPRPTRV